MKINQPSPTFVAVDEEAVPVSDDQKELVSDLMSFGFEESEATIYFRLLHIVGKN